MRDDAWASASSRRCSPIWRVATARAFRTPRRRGAISRWIVLKRGGGPALPPGRPRLRRLSYGARRPVPGMGSGAWIPPPLAAHPTQQVVRFQVSTRPDDQIGIDELADEGLTHRGVCPASSDAGRACPRSMLRTRPRPVEDLARWRGCLPGTECRRGIVSGCGLANGRDTVAPCDDASAALVGTSRSCPQWYRVPATCGRIAATTWGVLAVARAQHRCSCPSRVGWSQRPASIL